MRYSNSEIVQKTVEDLLAQGCIYDNSKRSKHAKLVFPNGHKLAIPYSVSDGRSGLNFRALVRQIIAKGGLNGNP